MQTLDFHFSSIWPRIFFFLTIFNVFLLFIYLFTYYKLQANTLGFNSNIFFCFIKFVFIFRFSANSYNNYICLFVCCFWCFYCWLRYTCINMYILNGSKMKCCLLHTNKWSFIVYTTMNTYIKHSIYHFICYTYIHIQL